MSKLTPLPFGLQFEEHPTASNFIVPVYDEDEDISVILTENGQRVPSVEYYGNIGTKTLTHVQEENTDDDQDVLQTLQTKTGSAVQEESADSDEEHFSLTLSTKTGTFVQAEQTDEDPGVDTSPRPPLTTGTATKATSENTDND